ncbi:MAG TPA: pyridoxamine 5'-phosphate oxidase [Terriglobales bacterium]|nr:pyridoxamine 5'-phosphate oxidase [Terriglobales bacterium]
MIDPIAKFRRALRAAAAAGTALPEAMALATADERGRPSLRYVLLKSAGPSGFVFYTNSRSRKGRELAVNPWASLAFYWDSTGIQVRVEGPVKRLPAEEADLYWATRPRGSQLAGAVSQQSEPLLDRRDLLARYRALERALQDGAVERPPHWLGYRLMPRQIEFWARREPRLHHRELYRRSRNGWRRSLLQP